MNLNLDKLYERMFSPDELARRNRLWAVLCAEWFQKYIGETDTVLDLGAGSCEFINNIRCSVKIAVDKADHTRERAAKDVRVVPASAEHIEPVESGTVDVVFASNFFEHLQTKVALLDVFLEIRRVLKPGGKLLVLSPNIAYSASRYWDDFGHHIPLSHVSMADCLKLSGFVVREVRSRFLPFTTRSRVPQSPFLVKWYLRLPPLHRLMGRQMFFHAEKR